MAEGCVAAWPRAAAQLAEAFWPGPLSLVLPKADSIPDIVTAGGKTVAVRCPAHPVFRAVLAKCGFPLAAPSANRSNRVSPTRAEHVVDQLGGRIPLVLDGGACDLGIESTVLDLTGDTPTLLRPGMISLGQLQAVLGPVATAKPPAAAEPLKSPGQLQRALLAESKADISGGRLGRGARPSGRRRPTSSPAQPRPPLGQASVGIACRTPPPASRGNFTTHCTAATDSARKPFWCSHFPMETNGPHSRTA